MKDLGILENFKVNTPTKYKVAYEYIINLTFFEPLKREGGKIRETKNQSSNVTRLHRESFLFIFFGSSSHTG